MSTGGTLIVGAGQAGVELAAALRAAGDERPITMIGTESHAPYQRPPLSKGFLKDPSDAGNLLLRDSAWFAQQDITVACGESVDSLVWESGTAGTALTSTGREIGFASLALATGANPRRLPLPGTGLEGIHYLRSVDDATKLAHGLGSQRTWWSSGVDSSGWKSPRRQGNPVAGSRSWRLPTGSSGAPFAKPPARSICRQFSGGERRCAPERI